MKKFKILIVFLCFASYLGAQNYIMYSKDSTGGGGRNLYTTPSYVASHGGGIATIDTTKTVASGHYATQSDVNGKTDKPDTTIDNITTSIVLTFANAVSTHRQDTISGNVTISVSKSANARPGYTKTYMLIGSGNSRTINYGTIKKASGSAEYDDASGVINILMFRLLTNGIIERTIYYLQ